MLYPLPNNLTELIALKKKQIAQRQVIAPLAGLRALASMQARPKDIPFALREQHVALLASTHAEDPTANPGQGDAYDPMTLVRRLLAQGVAALVVPKVEHLNRGGIEDFTLLSNAIQVPIIRQDMIIDEYQIVEARAAGADGLLLMATALEAVDLRQLISITQRHRMTVIAQVHDEESLRLAASFEPRVIAIDNRDLFTSSPDLDKTTRLAKLVPPHILLLSMGGMHSAEDVARVVEGPVDGVVVGPQVIHDPAQAVSIRKVLEYAPLRRESEAE